MAIMGWKNKKIIIFAFLVTVLFCTFIAFDIFPFLRGPAPYPPDWQWDYLFVNTISRVWMPLLFIGVTLFFAFFLEQKSDMFIIKHQNKILFGCIILFFCIQISLSYFSRAGLGVLISRIVNPDMNGYFTAANNIKDISLFLKQFNQKVLSLPMHAQGHPPGAILFFWGIEYILRPISPLFSFLEHIRISHNDIAVLWKNLTLSQKVVALFTSFFIPFLSTFSCFFVYYIGRYLYTTRVGIRAAVLLLTIPSLLLFIPINDVFLPLFPLSSFLCFIIGLKEEKKYLLFISGIIFSLGLFFSLSLAPLLFIFAVYLLWNNNTNIQKILYDGIIFLAAILLLPVMLYLFFGYDTIVVSQTLMSGLPEGRDYITWVFFNLSDFFIFLGVPLSLYFCLVLFQLVKNIRIRTFKNLDPLTGGFIGMLISLDISGSVRGEVARIWIPFYPFIVLILALFITKQLKVKNYIFISILCLQFLQILFMQEFWVMLW